ncbi:MAG: efflux RND transporter periplasmic adaptor subunit [Phycisphaerales bacterium]
MIWAAAAGAVALTGGLSAQPPSGGPPPTPVVVDEARMEPAEQWREVTGELRAARRALLATEEEGLIVSLEPQEGDQVEAGQVVARLRDTRAKLDVQKAEADLAVKAAEVAAREADVSKARRDVERIEEVMARSSAAASEVEDRKILMRAAEARLAGAKADVQSAQAALDWVRERLARMAVTAPFRARVVAKKAEVGQWARQGEPVLEVVALDEIDARVDVPEAFIDQLVRSGAPVRIRLSATGEVVEAPIAGVIPDADSRSRLFPVRVRLANPEGRLRPGMSIAALVPTGARQATLTISKDGVLRNDAGEYVLFNAGGTAAVAPVRTLFPVGDRVAVQSSALRPGAQVIVEGNERLFPGMPVAATVRGAVPANGGAAGATGPAATSPGEGR